MGLFAIKKEKPVVVPEPDNNLVNWFFTVAAENAFEQSVYVRSKEMYEVWFSQYGPSQMAGYIQPKGHPFRKEYPCTFFADYLRALKTMASSYLALNAADLAIDGDGADAIPYPDCLKAERNPLINFAIKIKPIIYCKHGEDLTFNNGMKTMICYLHDAFVKGVDESNEQWIYEKSLWFNAKGKIREDSEIIADIKAKVKIKSLIR